MGGLSSYCRSFFGLLIPPGSEAAFYALYAITDKGSSAVGPAVVGVIVDATGQPRRIPVAEIEEQKKLSVSAMPANIVESLKEPQLFDLLAFLLSQQQERLNSSENSPRSNR